MVYTDKDHVTSLGWFEEKNGLVRGRKYGLVLDEHRSGMIDKTRNSSSTK